MSEIKLNAGMKALLNSLPPEMREAALASYSKARAEKQAANAEYVSKDVIELTEYGAVNIKPAGRERGTYVSPQMLQHIVTHVDTIRTFLQQNQGEITRRQALPRPPKKSKKGRTLQAV